MKKIVLDKAIHRKQDRILIQFPYDKGLIDLVKTLPDARWSQTRGCWHVGNNPENLKAIFSVFKGEADVNAHHIFHRTKPTHKGMPKERPIRIDPYLDTRIEAQLREFKRWMQQKRYSDSTVNTYISLLKVFFRFLQNKRPDLIEERDVLKFNSDYVLAGGYSATFQNQVINAIKLFYQIIEQKQICPENLERPRRYRALPNILSKEEVSALLKTPLNLKHRAMLSLIYACGLRRSELLNLKQWNVDYDRKVLIIKCAKGNKDRIAPLPQNIVWILKEYTQRYKPVMWLFEGQKKGHKYSETSLQEVFRSTVEKSGINKRATLHWLRHSYATHLLENGTDLRYIQEILGHKSSRTTEIYTHVSRKNIEQIKSPFDDLEI